jgi:hypothetical protein
MPTFTLQLRNHQLDVHNAQTLARITIETANSAGHTSVSDEPRVLSRLGDELQLRGIPAIGRGVQGAILGTRPGTTR